MKHLKGDNKVNIKLEVSSYISKATVGIQESSEVCKPCKGNSKSITTFTGVGHVKDFYITDSLSQVPVYNLTNHPCSCTEVCHQFLSSTKGITGIWTIAGTKKKSTMSSGLTLDISKVTHFTNYTTQRYLEVGNRFDILWYLAQLGKSRIQIRILTNALKNSHAFKFELEFTMTLYIAGMCHSIY